MNKKKLMKRNLKKIEESQLICLSLWKIGCFWSKKCIQVMKKKMSRGHKSWSKILGIEKKMFLEDEKNITFMHWINRIPALCPIYSKITWFRIFIFYGFIQEYHNFILMCGLGGIPTSSQKIHQFTQSYYNAPWIRSL